MKLESIKSKIVWITGSSSGIGLALTKIMLANGATVIASSRHLEALSVLKKQYGNHLELVPMDVVNYDSVNDGMTQISQKYQKIDIAILNAGNCHYMDATSFKVSELNKNFDVNFFGLANCIEACLPLLSKAKCPQLVGMSSAVAYLPLPRAEGYGAAKAATYYLLKTLQCSLSRRNIFVSIICPGFVKTPLTDCNDFEMPFLISAEAAAQKITRGILKRNREIAFPSALIILFKLINILPNKLRIFLIAKFVARQ